ncbi:hypothetical protein AMAG_15279 [Allomyces macrogynus ATCC 38327]|uniref:CBS domain-containing protein n=1 Tax=Allomyces macrogynus (strain ATCC 38327) TaxID=578462 RepID=A0A0L0T8K0_ALLM3|nr:hypothetical protein AMAG_15279 [Allomyces macrogynus ATCC 38327]|eukprot:KNE71021.1 hypothetical protein AMAG_15279 [Allomyces macrogynus ATCC 38327]
MPVTPEPKVCSTVLDHIGNTPLVRLQKIPAQEGIGHVEQMALTNIVQHAARKKKQSHTMLRAVSDLLGQHMSSAQIYMARGLLEWIFKINAVKPGFMKERELKDAHLADLQHLYQQLYWIPVVQALPDVVGAATDLSELWYKEFYLELSKQIQFPIETSLPWILIHQILDSSAVDLTHALFVPFLIYDDAANRALNELKMQYLYDEIEAEANLAFDLFLHKYSHMVFAHFKCKAASLYLGEALKAKMGKAAGIEVPLHQHEHIMRHYKTVKIVDALGSDGAMYVAGGGKVVVILPDSVRNYMTKFLSDAWMKKNGFISAETVAEEEKRLAPFRGATVADLKLPRAVTATRGTACRDAVLVMQKNGFDQLPVVASGAANAPIVGLVTLGNILSRVSSGRVTLNSPVDDAMFHFDTKAKEYFVITPDTPLADLSAFFEKNSAGVVTAPGSHAVVAVVTKIDLMAWLVQSKV